MTPPEKISRLRELAQAARDYQSERGLNDSQMLVKFGQLGSTKTYKRILNAADDLDGLNLDNQIEAYDTVAEMVAKRRQTDRPPEKEYEDFANVSSVLSAVTAALAEDSIARFVSVTGENGTGKGACQNAMLRRWGKISRRVEAYGMWKHSLAVPATAIARCLKGGDEWKVRGSHDEVRMPTNPDRVTDIILEETMPRALILMIDEFHESGPRAINLVRTIISQTPTVVVGFAVPQLLKALVSSGYEECKQLFGNRLCRAVRLNSPDDAEILLLLKRRGVAFADKSVATECGKTLAGDAPAYGNWRFVNRVCRKMLEKNKPLDLEAMASCVTKSREECVSLGGRK